jgi:hypothetical protein
MMYVDDATGSAHDKAAVAKISQDITEHADTLTETARTADPLVSQGAEEGIRLKMEY